MSYIGKQPVPQSLQSRQQFTGDGSTTTFATIGGVELYEDVFLNGVRLSRVDNEYSFDGTTLTITPAPANGDTVSIILRNDHSELIALPITDSQGNNVLSESGSVVTLTADQANVGSNALVVDSSGNVLVGATSAVSNQGVIQAKTSVATGPGAYSASNTNYNSGNYNWTFGMNGVGAFVVYINPTVSGNSGVYLNAGATSWTGNSDERLKDITGNIENAIDSVKSLRAVKYTLKADNAEIKTQRVGLIAQDVQAVLPEIIDVDQDGYLGIRYAEITTLLVAAIKEQQTLIESQQSQIDALTAKTQEQDSTIASLISRIEALEATP